MWDDLVNKAFAAKKTNLKLCKGQPKKCDDEAEATLQKAVKVRLNQLVPLDLTDRTKATIIARVMTKNPDKAWESLKNMDELSARVFEILQEEKNGPVICKN